jgi:COP9 signalosome complex subunit 2
MLDFIEKNAEDEAANRCMEQFYSQTLDSFQATNNERLWLSTNTKLARLWLAQKDYERLTGKVRELHKACQREDGSDDPSKGTYSMEAYALEIQMYAETRNNKRLKVCKRTTIRISQQRTDTVHRDSTNVLSRCDRRCHIPRSWESSASVVARCT